MSKLIGKWDYVGSENVDTFLKEMSNYLTITENFNHK
jgi:hypothetical protein